MDCTKKLAGAAAIVLSAATVGAAAPSDPVAQRLGWLAGCWGGEKGTTAFREIWTVASPDLLVGVNVTTKPAKPAEFEYLRIETRRGTPAYVAQPGGAPPTAFEWSAEESTADTATFVNMQHDFPKRIAYRRIDASSLLAWIDAGPKGALRVEFPMRRVPCPGPAESR